MKIAFNPSTVAALTSPPNNNDITFDLKGRNIFARGVKFDGSNTWRSIYINGTSIGTNILNIVGATVSTKDGTTTVTTRDTWRQIKINNVSIGTNTLDLRNGTNVTLTNNNGVVTISSTWRPVVDNLTSTSTTSSLSANMGRYLKSLIDGKASSDHNHDSRYVKKVGDLPTSAYDVIITPTAVSGSNYVDVGGGLHIKAHTGTQFLLWLHDTSNVWYKKTGTGAWQKMDAGCADKLMTARTINNTSFDGTANITTSIWGTARTITIGNTAKSVNGSANVSWSLSEIGAASSSHNHDSNYLKYNGWWNSTDTHDLNDASHMIFAYKSHTNAPFPNWGIVTTFSYSLNSHYRFQIASNGYTNALFYRNKSADRKDNDGWTSWVKVLDSGNTKLDGSTITINGSSITVSKSDHTHTWASITNKITSSNLFNMLPKNYSQSSLVFNGSAVDGGLLTNPISSIRFYAGDLANLVTLIAKGFSVNGSASWFLKADGSVDKNSYSLSSHNHDGRYVQKLYLAGDTTNKSNITGYSGSYVIGTRNVDNAANYINYGGIGLDNRSVIIHLNGNLGTTHWNLLYLNSGNVSFRTENAQTWRRLAFVDELPASIKNPYALTLQANGTTLATYDGSVARTVNFTYSNVGAAAANHNHNSLYITDITTSVNKLTFTKNGSNTNRTITVNEVQSWSTVPNVTNGNHADSLKLLYTNNTTTIPRNKFISMYSSAMSNGSYYMGYFLSGYNDNPYGGFFVAHYNAAYYIGVSSGNFVQHKLAYTTDIPSSIKNPYSLTTFGVVYDGSAAKTVTPENFISLLSEGTSTISDGTMLITSVAPTTSGFADTSALNKPYKRKAIHLWNYINSKTIANATNADKVDGYHETDFFRYRGNIDTAYIDLTTYTANATGYLNPLNGVYKVSRTGSSEMYIAFTGSGSTSGLDLHTNYAFSSPLKYRHRIDSNRLDGGWRTILDSNNYSSFTDSHNDGRYVKKTGDTMTGILNFGGAYQINNLRVIDGEPANGTNHILKLGYTGNDKVDWYETGGVWNFYKVATSKTSPLIRLSAASEFNGSIIVKNANFTTLTVLRNDDSNGAAISFRGSSNVYGHIGFNNANKDKLALRWNSTTGAVYTILDTSSTRVSGQTVTINNVSVTVPTLFANVIVNQHTSNDVNYPLVWSNLNNTSSNYGNLLYKSYSDLYYNPKNKRLYVANLLQTNSIYITLSKSTNSEGTVTHPFSGITGLCADNDYWRIGGGGTNANSTTSSSNNGYMELATADDGTEPIYVRQYSGNYATIKRTLTLLNASGHSIFPSYISIGGNENNNSSPDRVWGSNSSDTYLRSYRTSALRVSYASNSDLLDGVHLNGIFTNFGNNGTNITATIGGVTKTFEVKYANYASHIKGGDRRNNADTPSYYMTNFSTGGLHSEFSKQGTQFGNNGYSNLITSIPWKDSSGGRPALLVFGNHIGFRLASSDSAWGSWNTIPEITSAGVMEVGRYMDWHYNNDLYGSQDFSTRLIAQDVGSSPNTVYLPSASGILALKGETLLWLYHVVDMRNYDAAYWHPVTVPLVSNGYNKIRVTVLLDIGDTASWTTHSSGFTCNMEIWATKAGWGTTAAETICLNYTYLFANANPCGWMLLTNPSLGVVFLRGGVRYKIYTDFDAVFTPHDKLYTQTYSNSSYNQSTGGPYTSCPGLNFNKNKIYANLDGYAARLEGGSIPTWGTLTAANGYTNVSSYDYGTRGAYGWAGKSGQMSMQVDGYFYLREGNYRVIDSYDYNWTNLPGKISASNEFNIVSAGFNSDRFWFNYLPLDNRNSTARIGAYYFGNGLEGLSSIYAYRYMAEGKGCMWKDGRDYAAFSQNYSSGYNPTLNMRTKNGDWSIGTYPDGLADKLIFAYVSNSDYNSGTNNASYHTITTDGIYSGAARYIRHAPGYPQSYVYSTSTGTYDGAIQIREVNEVLNNQSAWGYAPRITFHWGTRYAKGFGMRSDGLFAVDDVPIALTSNVMTFTNDTNYVNASFNNSELSKKANSTYIECWDSSGGWWNWKAGKFMKEGSSDAYVLLGGGGHKPLSDFLLGGNSYLPYNGWWTSGDGSNVDNANGMIFAYSNHTNAPFGSGWGIVTTVDYAYNSGYKAQIAVRCDSNALFYRGRNGDRGSYNSWYRVLDSSNYTSYVNNYYWADIKVSTTSSLSTSPHFSTAYTTNWFRSIGATGWYNETYTGGIYMTDSTWIRTYGGKSFYCDHLIYSSDSIRMSDLQLQYSNEINNTAGGKIYINHRNSGNIVIGDGGGAVSIGTASDLLGGNRLYVNGSEYINGASNVVNHVYADGFRHRLHNNNDAVLLAGGGYSLGVPVRYWAIYELWIGTSSTDIAYSKRSGNYNFIASNIWEETGCAMYTLNFPSGYSLTNTMIYGNGDHLLNSNWKTTLYATITTHSNFSTSNTIRILLSDDSSRNAGFAHIYFLCMG